MHAVRTVEELDMLLAPEGAYAAATEAKKAGKIRHIGISMHGQPAALIEAAKRGAFEAVMTTVNYYDRCNYPEIEDGLLPLANAKGMGVILMKPLADGFLHRSAEQALRYAFTRPVSVVVAGINNMKMLETDLRLAESYRPMSAEEEAGLLKDALELGAYVCRQCGKCACPRGVDIQEVFAAEGWYDRQMMRGVVEDAAEYALMERLRFWFGNEDLGRERYAGLGAARDAGACDSCGECLKLCPYAIDIPKKLRLADYKLAGRDIY
jgi:predicted aldo/keto reductase-like oxidoreductase